MTSGQKMFFGKYFYPWKYYLTSTDHKKLRFKTRQLQNEIAKTKNRSQEKTQP